MIRISLTGGLGNQMFQYAYGRSRSIKTKEALAYCFVHYRGNTKRRFELDVFDIKGVRIDGFLPKIFINVCRLLGTGLPLFESGYWQSPKYFSGYEKEIRDDFLFIKPLDRRNLYVLDLIKKTNSVSIHIRRGDYVTNKITNKFHGICDTDYYQKAVRYINRKIKKPTYFVFSDDPKWAKENLKLKNATYINWNNRCNSYKDMQLMSSCKNNIIANSSFSWWAAWLNQNSDKVVITPRRWFNDRAAQEGVKDLNLHKWIKL